MSATTPLDLAATCAELIGRSGVLAIKSNQLLRVYRDVPPELRELQKQIALSKQALEQLLPLLDRDQPAFQHPNDIEAIDLHLKAITFVIKDVHAHVVNAEQARTGPSPDWATVRHLWRVEDIAEEGVKLSTQVGGITVYLKVSRPESEAQHLVEVTDVEDKARLIAAWDDAATFVSLPTPTTSSAAPSISVDGSRSPQPEHSGTVSPITQSTQSAQTSPSLHNSSVVRHTGPSQYPLPNYAAASRVIVPTMMQQLEPPGQRRSSYWRDALKGQGLNIPSARKIKSMAMLQKSPVETTTTQNTTGDELYPTEFKSRVSAYVRGISPIWELKNVPAKRKEIKQRYRNRFTRDPSDDLSPEKLQSHFKVTESVLWDAILNREVEKVSKIMEHRWTDNLIVEKRDRITALHLAASLGLCSVVQILISLGASPNHADRYGATALHYAADFGCANCIHILSQGNAKIDLDSPKTHVKTALFYAARKGNVEATSALLSLGAHVYIHTATPQETILYAAVESGNVEIVKAILDKGGNPGESFDVLFLAAKTSREALRHLVEAGADINIHDSNQETLLYKYLMKNDPDTVWSLVSLGAKSRITPDRLGRTMLHLVLDKGGCPEAPALVRALLRAGDHPDVQNSLGQTPMHLAVLWGRADVADVLCQAGANMHTPDSKGVTPFQETEMLGYARRASSGVLADFPGTKALLERWQRGSVSRVAEVHGHSSKALYEADGRAAGAPRVELANTVKPIHELSGLRSPSELADSRKPVHEMDGRPIQISRKPVMAELPA